MVLGKRLLALLCAATIASVSLAQDTKCYYPNGKEADSKEKPCSSAEGSACCPEGWACLDNGLCHYEPDNFYARYSCTDETWEAEGCPSNLCTYGMTAYGGEGIAQCSNHDNQWCCDADRTHVDCCQESPEPRPFFDLPKGNQYAVVPSSTANSAPNLATFTGLASGSGDSQPSSTRAPSSSDSPSSSSPSSSSKAPSSSDSPSSTSGGGGGGTSSPVSTPMTSLRTSVTSGTAGPSTVIITEIYTPTSAANTSDSSSSSKSNLPVIVGCAVGIPLGLALIGIVLWLLRKNRKQKKHPYSQTPDPYDSHNDMGSPDFAGGAKLQKPEMTAYKAEHNVPELGGTPAGPQRPVSTIQGKAELDSGPGFSEGTIPYGPNTVGIGGGNGNTSSWGSAPPGYSPGNAQSAFTPGHGRTPSEGATPATDQGQYVAYRPPPGHGHHNMAGGGLQDINENPIAELSAATTPPAKEEK